MTTYDLELNKLYKKIEEIIYDRNDFLALNHDYIDAMVIYKVFKDSTNKISRINNDQIFNRKAYELLAESMYWYELETLYENIDIMIEMLDSKKAYNFINSSLPFYKENYVI